MPLLQRQLISILRKGILGTLLVVTSLYLTLPWWSIWLANRLLPDSITISHLQSARPGLTSWHIDSFSLSLDEWQLSGHQLDIDWNKMTLKLEQIKVLRVEQSAKQQTSNRWPDIQQAIDRLLETTWLIHINNVQFLHPALSFNINQLQLASDRQNLYLSANLNDKEQHCDLNALAMTQAKNITLKLSQDAQYSLPIANIDYAPKRLTVSVKHKLPECFLSLLFDDSVEAKKLLSSLQQLLLTLNQDEQNQLTLTSRGQFDLPSNYTTRVIPEQLLNALLNANKNTPVELNFNIRSVPQQSLMSGQAWLDINSPNLQLSSAAKVLLEGGQPVTLNDFEAHINGGALHDYFNSTFNNLHIDGQPVIHLTLTEPVSWPPNTVGVNYRVEKVNLAGDNYELDTLLSGTARFPLTDAKEPSLKISLGSEIIKAKMFGRPFGGSVRLDFDHDLPCCSKLAGAAELTLRDESSGADITINWQQPSLQQDGTLILDLDGINLAQLSTRPAFAPLSITMRGSKQYSLTDLQPLLPLLSQHGKKITLENGHISQLTALSLDKALKANSRWQFEKLNFHYDKIKVTDASANIHLKVASHLNVNGDLNIEQMAFANQLAIHHLSLSLEQGNLEKIALSDIKGELLQGSFHSRKMVLDSGEILPTLLEFYRIDLAQLVALLSIDGLYIDGNIQAKIPLRTQNGKLLIENGSFTSLSKGKISYDSGKPISDDNIALLALQNFNYDSLQGTLSFDEGAHYQIQLKLTGANPELYNGYPIAFTLNLNGTLPEQYINWLLSDDFRDAAIGNIPN